MNATAVPCGLKGAVARKSAGRTSGGSGDRLQCSRNAVSENVCLFCLMPLVDSFISCSGCREKFHPEMLCMGVELEEKMIFVLLEVNVRCCKFLLL